jgi:hypothetical protein
MNSGFSYLTQTQENKWVFYAAGNSWQVWDKPDGCNFIHIVAIGAGAGGGGGYQKSSSASGGGGGGGVSSGISTMMIPAYVIPDKLHIQVGTGGAGGANLTAGSISSPTYVSLIPDATNTLANTLISSVQSTAISTAAGSAGSASGGLGGNPSNVSNSMPFAGWSKYNISIILPQAGQAGTTPVINLEQTRIVGGGAGGAFTTLGAQIAGRSITSSYKQPSAVVYSVGEPLGISGKAGNGPNLISPQPQFFGGAGGAALTTTNIANGGNGGIGCGGGGAGPNLTGGSSTGGKGGDGMVIITCW